MAALLKIVQPPTAALPESVCRVFNTDLMDRLSAINAATRALRGLGYRVAEQHLFPAAGGKPRVRIERDRKTSIKPLLDRSHRHYWKDEGGKKHGVAEFLGVTVTWDEA